MAERQTTVSDDVLAGIAGTDVLAFERATHAVAKALADGEALAELFDALCSTLSEANELGARERDRRLRLLIDRFLLPPELLRTLTERAKESAPWAINVLLTLTPPEHRQLRRTEASIQSPQVSGHVQSSNNLEPVVGGPAKQLDLGPPPEAFRAVALVGLKDEHANNRALLDQGGLRALLVPTVDALYNVAPTGLCGVVIGPSVWTAADSKLHRAILERLCELSTLLFFRIATRGLARDVANQLHEIQREKVCGVVAASRCCQADDCQLTPSDIQALHEIASHQSSVEGTVFHPAGLTESQARFLRVLLVRRAGEIGKPISLRTVSARPLVGGRSGATVFLVLPDDKSPPVVLKFDVTDGLRSEVSAYQKWIKDWDAGSAEPHFDTHLGDSVLTYRLQASPDSPEDPAPTLEERLEQFRAEEIWEPAEKVVTAEHDVGLALERTVAGLKRLNERSTTELPRSEFWIDWSTNELIAKGVIPSLFHPEGDELDLASLMKAARERINKLDGRAITHGDVQLRNVLLHDRVPVFIDFARSGPGHPCYDLATFDGSVRRTLFRMLEPETRVAAFARRLYVDGVQLETLQKEFPRLLGSASNRLVARTAIAVRATAVELATRLGGSATDFLALTFIVANFLLAQLAQNSGLERAIICGIARPMFAA